jgi:hypothetical protein
MHARQILLPLCIFCGALYLLLPPCTATATEDEPRDVLLEALAPTSPVTICGETVPMETQRFVFRILAIKQIMENPEKHGFRLHPGDYYPAAAFTSVSFNAVEALPLRLIARAAGTDFKTIKGLNPQIRGYYLNAGKHTLGVPPGAEVGFKDRLAELAAADKKNRRQHLYIVKEGDSLSAIAQKFDVPLAALLIRNRIRMDKAIHPGQRLVVLPAGGRTDPESRLNEDGQ